MKFFWNVEDLDQKCIDESMISIVEKLPLAFDKSYVRLNKCKVVEKKSDGKRRVYKRVSQKKI